MRLLLISNSSNFGEEYLDYCKSDIKNFVREKSDEIIFIPYAAITVSWDDYETKVKKALSGVGLSVRSIHRFDSPVAALDKADCIMVGGGYTFQLLFYLYQLTLIEKIRNAVKSGLPYIGWSAGIHIVCPTIQTANDMPVIYPPSFNSLNLLQFQINPHYTEDKILGHNGESRTDRIREYIEVNRDRTVLGLPEGMILEVYDGRINLIGSGGVKLFRYGLQPEWVTTADQLNKFLNS